MSGCMISPPIELHHCECENFDRACCAGKDFQTASETSHIESDDCRAGSGHEDPQGGRQGKLVSPERRRRTVSTVRCRFGPERVSERRACRVLVQPRNTQRYQSRRADDEPGLLHEMRLLARQRPRFGSGRIYRLLT